jgi:hypothetical protein
MRRVFIVGALGLAALVVSSVPAGEGLQSGPAEGKRIPGPFDCLNINGSAAGKKICLV